MGLVPLERPHNDLRTMTAGTQRRLELFRLNAAEAEARTRSVEMLQMASTVAGLVAIVVVALIYKQIL